MSKDADPFKKDKYQQNILYYIAKNGKARLLSYLINRYQYDLNENDQIHQTPLFFAASEGHIEAARVLIDNGADINHVDMNGQNCMFWSAGRGHLDMCKFLVSRGVQYLKVDGNR